MQISNQQKIIIGVVLLLIGAYLLFDKNNNSPVVTENNTASTTDKTSVIGVDGTGGYTIKQISETTIPAKSIKMPDLTRPVTFSQNLDENIKNIITEKITSLQAELKKDPTSFSKWVDLGMYQKMAGDYVGASLSWKYIAESAPNDFISYGNLGDLYAYYIKDKAMAETYYKKAISNAPKQVYLYTQLAGVYKDVFLDIEKAKAILDQGLKNIPDDKTLVELRNSLNK